MVKTTRKSVGAGECWSAGLSVQAAGSGTVAHAGVVLPRLLADRVGLTAALDEAVARVGFVPIRPRGRLLVDAACALAAGASCLADVEAMTAQVELYGPGGGASDSTVLRALNELSETLTPAGLPARRLARGTASVRARAWASITARHDGLPSVLVAGRPLTRLGSDGQPDSPVVVIRLDATVIAAASDKEGAEANYKGYGFHPLTGWCSNTGENLAMMQRVGSAGSFTAADHVVVLDAAIAQVPPGYRRDVLVTTDGAGASHEFIDHLHALNTAAAHGRRGRRVEYSIGWPLDARTTGAIDELPEHDWTPALKTDGEADDKAQVAELTSLLRHSHHGDQLATWPADMRVFVRRVQRLEGEQPELGQDAAFRYGSFVTNTTTGQGQWLDARHRTQAHVEDRIKELKACGAQRLPSKDYARNSAWLQLAAHAVTLLAWTRLLALDAGLAFAEPKTLRFRVLAAPARYVRHARKRILKIPTGWAWAGDITTAWNRIAALHPT